jgi:hypothetical protein
MLIGQIIPSKTRSKRTPKVKSEPVNNVVFAGEQGMKIELESFECSGR